MEYNCVSSRYDEIDPCNSGLNNTPMFSLINDDVLWLKGFDDKNTAG